MYKLIFLVAKVYTYIILYILQSKFLFFVKYIKIKNKQIKNNNNNHHHVLNT